MAKETGIWGIDIGQCSLKALRCTLDDSGELVADAFDLIEYPKILSQPDANPEELIQEALEQFLSRNDVRGDKVAISVPGQAGLDKKISLPPVDTKKLPDLIEYEAKGVIPFPIEDVIWDYHLIGGRIEEGRVVKSDCIVFAMKREAVFKALQPMLEAEVEVDVVQLAPLTIYNVVANDVVRNAPSSEDYDPESPPDSTLVISIGTDTTDILMTDGHSMQLRNIPIGGNHFTKQLSRELKLTYMKAEHLKRNARKAEDPKTIFQAMRPVFSDLVSELQRSISFFQSKEKKAKIGQIAMFGNASNLPGLRPYLAKHLGMEIVKQVDFRSLKGDSVTASKQFKDNALSFTNCYGLCLQASGKSQLQTNLLPKEFITERLIRAKKPWVLAAVGALLLGFSIHTFFLYKDWYNVHPDFTAENVSWNSALDKVNNTDKTLTSYKTTDQQQQTQLLEVHEMENAVAGVSDGRRLIPEILSAIHQLVPPYPESNLRPNDETFRSYFSSAPVDPEVVPYKNRPDIYIEYVETQYYPDLKAWYSNDIKALYENELRLNAQLLAGITPVDNGEEPTGAEGDEAAAENAAAGEAAATPNPQAGNGAAQAGNAAQPGAGAPGVPAAGGAAPGQPIAGQPGAGAQTQQQDLGPQGAGWVIEVKGYHYYNGYDGDSVTEGPRADGTGGGTYVRSTIIRRLLDKRTQIWLPSDSSQNRFERFPVMDMGLAYPVLVFDPAPNYNYEIENMNHPLAQNASAGGPGGASGGAPGSGDDEAEEDGFDQPRYFEAPRYDFRLQLVWVPTALNERLELREKRQEQRAQAEANAAQGASQPGVPPVNPNPAGGQPPANVPGNNTPQDNTPEDNAPQDNAPMTDENGAGDPNQADGADQAAPPNGNDDGANESDTGEAGAAEPDQADMADPDQDNSQDAGDPMGNNGNAADQQGNS